MRRVLLPLAVSAVLLVPACGEDDPQPADAPSTSSPSPSDTPSAVEPEGSPEDVIQAYFAAQRVGDAEAICALESEQLEIFKYDEAGQACLDDAGNNMAQPVWAEEIVVVSTQEVPGGISAVIQPNAGSDAQATIVVVAVDGEWQIGSFA